MEVKKKFHRIYRKNVFRITCEINIFQLLAFSLILEYLDSTELFNLKSSASPHGGDTQGRESQSREMHVFSVSEPW